MLTSEMIAFEQLSGENAELTSISRIGGFLDGYQKAMEKQQWIPCSEEEPPFGIEVLITRKGTVRLAEKSVFDKKYPWHIYGYHSYNAKTVDAWMPLPEPYKEDEQ